LIREVHVYGQSLGVCSSGSDTKTDSGQHRGYGKMLVAAAENLASQHGFREVAVIAGVGTREYYKNKCGYKLDKHYMKKLIPKVDRHLWSSWTPWSYWAHWPHWPAFIPLLLLLACARMSRIL
jgi:predicted N-acetyltransferase YhbS